MAATPAPTEAHTQTADLGASATVNPPQNEQSHGVSDETVTGTTVAAEPKPVWNPLAMARSGLAIFSTDLGRRPKRGPLAPVQPCIAHGDTLRGVVDFALRLQSTYPREYMFFFPLCGYTIFDLWDRADIHLYSPTFLEEVLSFITQDNVQHAQKYAAEWSQNHRDRLHVVLEVEYDQDRPLDIVDAIFVNGETNRFPPEFLWHVAHIMRYGMCVMSDRSKAVPPAVVAGAVAKAADSDAGNLNPRTDPAAEQMSKITPSNKQLPMAPPPGIAPRKRTSRFDIRSAILTVTRIVPRIPNDVPTARTAGATGRGTCAGILHPPGYTVSSSSGLSASSSSLSHRRSPQSPHHEPSPV